MVDIKQLTATHGYLNVSGDKISLLCVLQQVLQRRMRSGFHIVTISLQHLTSSNLDEQLVLGEPVDRSNEKVFYIQLLS